jgi:hypothetical protein
MTGDLDDLIDEILVDAYGDSEQLTAFEQAFEESARFPFPASIVGVSVDVVRIEFDGDERHGLTAHCRREGEKHQISLADLVPGPVTLETSRLLAAYRKWQGLPEFRPVSPAHAVEPWIYRPVAKNLHPVAHSPSNPWAVGTRPTSTGVKKAGRSTLSTERSSPQVHDLSLKWNR